MKSVSCFDAIVLLHNVKPTILVSQSITVIKLSFSHFYSGRLVIRLMLSRGLVGIGRGLKIPIGFMVH